MTEKPIEIYLTDKYIELAEELFNTFNEIIDEGKYIKDYILVMTTVDENIYEIDIKNVSFLGFYGEFIKIKVLNEFHFIKYDFINLISVVPKE